MVFNTVILLRNEETGYKPMQMLMCKLPVYQQDLLNKGYRSYALCLFLPFLVVSFFLITFFL